MTLFGITISLNNALLLSAIAIMLVGCGVTGKNLLLTTAKGGAVVLQAEDVATQIADYIAGDEQAINELMYEDGPVDYALKVSDFLKGRGETPLYTIVINHPTQLQTFKSKMLEGRLALVAYEDRSGKAIPLGIVTFWNMGEDVVKTIDKVVSGEDTTTTASEISAVLRPYVLFGLKMGLRGAGVPVP